MSALGEINDAQFQAWASRVKGKIDSGYVKEQISKSSKRIGEQALKQFKANTPVDTGSLRRSWTAKGPFYAARAWTIDIINNAEYASYVEEGHRQTPGRYVPAIGKKLKASWVPGQHFMRDSAKEVNAQLPELVTPGLWAFKDLLE